MCSVRCRRVQKLSRGYDTSMPHCLFTYHWADICRPPPLKIAHCRVELLDNWADTNLRLKRHLDRFSRFYTTHTNTETAVHVAAGHIYALRAGDVVQ